MNEVIIEIPRERLKLYMIDFYREHKDTYILLPESINESDNVIRYVYSVKNLVNIVDAVNDLKIKSVQDKLNNLIDKVIKTKDDCMMNCDTTIIEDLIYYDREMSLFKIVYLPIKNDYRQEYVTSGICYLNHILNCSEKGVDAQLYRGLFERQLDYSLVKNRMNVNKMTEKKENSQENYQGALPEAKTIEKSSLLMEKKVRSSSIKTTKRVKITELISNILMTRKRSKLKTLLRRLKQDEKISRRCLLGLAFWLMMLLLTVGVLDVFKIDNSQIYYLSFLLYAMMMVLRIIKSIEEIDIKTKTEVIETDSNTVYIGNK